MRKESKINAPVTKRQREVLRFIKSFIAQNHYPPSRAEIAGHFDIYPNAAQDIVNALARKDAIKLVKGVSRGIVVLGDEVAA